MECRIARRSVRPSVGMSIDDLVRTYPSEGGSMALYACADWLQHFLGPLPRLDDRAVASFHSLPSMHMLKGICSDIVSYGILIVMRGEDPSALTQAARELPRILRPKNTPFQRTMYHWMHLYTKEAVEKFWKVGKVHSFQALKPYVLES